MKIKRLKRTLPMLLSLSLVAGITAVAVNADDAFSGWDEDNKESALDVYETTDWESVADRLVYETDNINEIEASVSMSVRWLKDNVKDVVNQIAEEDGNVKENPDSYVQLMLALIEVLSDGNPSGDDPCNVKVYFNPNYTGTTKEESISYLFRRLVSCQNIYDSSHGDRASVKNSNNALSVVVEAVMLGHNYAKTATYSYESASAYYNSNKALFDDKGIVPLLNFADLVKSHYATTYVDYTESGGNTGVESSTMQKIAENAKNNVSTSVGTTSAAWVNGVYDASGVGNPGCTAIDYWNRWRSSGSSSSTNIPMGAAVICSGSSATLEQGDIDFEKQYGRVAIYVGSGNVTEYINGTTRTIPLTDWIQAAAAGEPMEDGTQGYIGWVWPFGNPLN